MIVSYIEQVCIAEFIDVNNSDGLGLPDGEIVEVSVRLVGRVEIVEIVGSRLF